MLVPDSRQSGTSIPIGEAGLRLHQGSLSGIGEEHSALGIAARILKSDDCGAMYQVRSKGAVCLKSGNRPGKVALLANFHRSLLTKGARDVAWRWKDARSTPVQRFPNLNREDARMSEYEHITYHKRERIGIITLNRPEKLNAWTGTMEREFIDVLDKANKDSTVGCLIVTGAGRGFCAGADISGWAAHHAQEEGDDASSGYVPALATTVEQHASPNVPLALADSKPVIAAVNGAAIGIGLTLAMACDIRIASDRARFSARFVRVGLIPECGGSHNIPQVAGVESAMELILTGRIIDASDPLALKLVSRIVPHDELIQHAYALADEIAQGPTNPVWLAKREIRRNVAEQNLRQVVATETQLFAQVNGQPEHREATLAFLEKREPRWH